MDTQAVTTGPASGPRPTSSMPATRSPSCPQRRSSICVSRSSFCSAVSRTRLASAVIRPPHRHAPGFQQLDGDLAHLAGAELVQHQRRRRAPCRTVPPDSSQPRPRAGGLQQRSSASVGSQRQRLALSVRSRRRQLEARAEPSRLQSSRRLQQPAGQLLRVQDLVAHGAQIAPAVCARFLIVHARRQHAGRVQHLQIRPELHPLYWRGSRRGGRRP